MMKEEMVAGSRVSENEQYLHCKNNGKKMQVLRVSQKFIITAIYNHLRKMYHYLSV